MTDAARGLAGLRAAERTLPLLPAFAGLIPGCALRRGGVVACSGDGARSLAASLVAGPSQDGAWVGIAGLATIGGRALAELGVDLGRVVLVAEPVGGFSEGQWGEVLAAMIDGFDVVLAGRVDLRPATARKVQARLQSRGAVLVLAGDPGPFAADVQLTCSRGAWHGLGDGHGVAVARSAHVAVHGRRIPRPAHATMWLPGPDGAVEPAAVAADTGLPLEAAGIAG